MIFSPTSRELASAVAWELYLIPYIYGGNDPIQDKGLDCSGFIRFILRQTGILSLKRDWTAHAIYGMFERHSRDEATVGCLAFYGKPDKISHVMFCLNEKLCIGAVNGGKWCTSVETAKERGAKVEMRAISYRLDLVAICDPFEGEQ